MSSPPPSGSNQPHYTHATDNAQPTNQSAAAEQAGQEPSSATPQDIDQQRQWLADRHLVSEEMAQPVVDYSLRGLGRGPHHLGWTDRRGQSGYLLLRAGVTLLFGLVGVVLWAGRALNSVESAAAGVIWVLPFVAVGGFWFWHDLRLWRAQRRLGVQPGDPPPSAPNQTPPNHAPPNQAPPNHAPPQQPWPQQAEPQIGATRPGEPSTPQDTPQMTVSLRRRRLQPGQLAGAHSMNRVAAERGIEVRAVRRALPRRIRPLSLRVAAWSGLVLLVVGGVMVITSGFDLGGSWPTHPAVLALWLGAWLAIGGAGLSGHRTLGAMRALVLGIGPTERAIVATTPEGSWRREVLRLHDHAWIRQFEGPPLTDTLRKLDEIEQVRKQTSRTHT